MNPWRIIAPNHAAGNQHVYACGARPQHFGRKVFLTALEFYLQHVVQTVFLDAREIATADIVAEFVVLIDDGVFTVFQAQVFDEILHAGGNFLAIGRSDHEQRIQWRIEMVRIHRHVVECRDAKLVDQGHHGSQLRTARGADQPEDIIDLNHLLQRLKRARRNVSVIFKHDLHLAAVDAAAGVHIFLPDFQRK